MFLPIGDNVEKREIPIIPGALILANVVVFVREMRIACTPETGQYEIKDFLDLWGLVPANLMDGEVIGLLSYMFLHGSFFHILGNMAVLWAFAVSLEIGLGMWTLLGFYLCCGVVGGIAHVLMDTTSVIPLVGASGAIAGLIGAYTVLYGPQSKIKCLFFLFFKPFVVQIPAGMFGIGWIMLQLWHANNSGPEGGGVAWWCHIGGFATGALLAAICRNDTALEMTADRNGEVSFQKRDSGLAMDPLDEARMRAATNFPIPENCTTCNAALGEDQRIANSLARCSNCEQMIYLEAVPEPAVSRR